MNSKAFDIIKKSYSSELNEDEVIILCELVNEDPSMMAYIYIDNEDIQMAAINSTCTKDYKDGRVIQVIKNASEQIKLLAVQKDGECIRYLLDPSEELQLAAVNQNKLAICFIKNPTQKVIDSARIIVKEGE
jgi:hypothetical protein